MIRKIVLFLPLLLCLSFIGYGQFREIGKIKESLKGTTDSLSYVNALNRLAILMYEYNIDSTFYFGRKAREIANRHNYTKGKADALNNLGIFFGIKGDVQLSLRYFNEAYNMYTSIEDQGNSVQAIMNIAIAYKETGKNHRALKWFDRAVRAGKELKQDSIMSLVYFNYLLYFPQKLKNQDRVKYMSRAKNIALKYNDERMILAMDKLVADELIVNGQVKAGLALVNQTIDSSIHKKFYYGSIGMLIDMGDKFVVNDPALALNYYQRALAIADKNDFQVYSQNVSKKIFDFYLLKKDTVSAGIYGRKLVLLREEQEKVNNLLSIDYLDYARKEHEVDALVVRSKYQVMLLVVITIACVLAIAITMVIRQNLKHTKKLNEKVIDQNDKMKIALNALEQSQADNTNILKIVAHDLRSPIAGIHALSGLMISDDHRSEDDLEMLKVIKDSSKDSLVLVNELLQAQFRTETLDKIPVNLAELLRHCVALLKSSADAKAQQILTDFKPIVVFASGEKLWRVMSNLIANAIKFSPNNTTIKVTIEQYGNQVRVGVADEGIGIPVEIEDKIFEMFSDAKRAGTGGEQPFGLGLAISKQIIAAHNGKLWFERKTKGVIFFVELPINID
ncbi:ATP-binding protein [Pedobacter sp. GSP4]|uniref:sensor histidine kinase n=1 Tax=Pedobacter sp. GSP4 TaxID=3453716 RepID=UPI003EEF0901